MCEPERTRLPVGRVLAVLGAAVAAGAGWAMAASLAQAFALSVLGLCAAGTVTAVWVITRSRAGWGLMPRPQQVDIRAPARLALPAPPLALEPPVIQGAVLRERASWPARRP